MKTMMVPNNLFAEMRDGLTSGRSKVNNEGVSSLLDTVFNGNKDAMTAQILLTGQEAFKATYGVSPERLTATSAACFLTIPLNYTQPFVGSPTCLKATASELSEIGAGFDAKRNSYGRIVTPARFELINAQDKPVTKITAKDDGLDYTPSAFFQAIASQINERVSSVSGNSLISIVLKKLYQLITGGYSVRRRPHRERTPDGRLTMVGAENEPLFHFMHFEGAGLFLQNTIRTDKSSDDSGEEMDVQVSVSNDDNVGEVAVSGNARATLYDTLVDDYLTNLTGKRVFRFAGYSPEEIPSVEDDTDTKRRFICDALMRISDSMKAAGSESYLQRMPGDTLKPVISDADKDAYGNNVTISKAWASFVRSAKENNVTFPPEAWAATVRCGLFAFVDRMLGWLNTFHGIELRADELVDYLIGSQEEFDKAKGFLTPNINMTEFFVEAMKDGLAKDAQMRSTVLKYILDMKNKMNSDILSDGVLSTVIQHVIDKYGDTSRMMTFAREIPPGDMHDFLEWCVVRFLMSGVDKDGKLIRPEDVPSSGDGIEQDDGERLIDMSLRKLGEWLRKTYLKTGNVSECMLLLFGLLLVSADLQDAVYRDAARINYSKTINNYESLSSSCFINTIKLPDALAKYGFSYLSEAIGKMSRDGGESLYMLLSIIKMDEPTDIQTLSEILGASDRSDVDARLGNVIFTLRGLSFIYFSGIK